MDCNQDVLLSLRESKAMESKWVECVRLNRIHITCTNALFEFKSDLFVTYQNKFKGGPCALQEWAGLTRILIEQFEVKLKRCINAEDADSIDYTSN